jgi:hypothetical protein
MFITDDSSAKVVDPKTGKEKPVNLINCHALHSSPNTCLEI